MSPPLESWLSEREKRVNGERCALSLNRDKGIVNKDSVIRP